MVRIRDWRKKIAHIIAISTKESGYGFGGIYVGLPECNKAYISKLFECVSQNIDKEFLLN